MRILLLTQAFNGLAQRLYVELTGRGHTVSVEFDIHEDVTREAVELFRPDLLIAPYLKRAIPEDVWRRLPCLIVHPGIRGDRGPSALDWAILGHESEWGVTLLQANAEMDAGDVWASVEFDLREASKGSLYRNEVTEAAVAAIRASLERMQRGEEPSPLRSLAGARGTLRPLMRQTDRAINWQIDSTDLILRKLRAADGTPGLADDIRGLRVHCYDAHPEDTLHGAPGELIAQRDGAICRATRDGALWITHLKNPQDTGRPFKLPAAMVLGERLQDVPTASLSVDAPVAARTWR